MEKSPIEVNDILYSAGGSYVGFYKVIDMTPTSIKVIELDSIKVEWDSKLWEGKKVAGDVLTNAKPMRRKVKIYNSYSGDNYQYIKITSYQSAYKWDGKPKYFTLLD